MELLFELCDESTRAIDLRLGRLKLDFEDIVFRPRNCLNLQHLVAVRENRLVDLEGRARAHEVCVRCAKLTYGQAEVDVVVDEERVTLIHPVSQLHENSVDDSTRQRPDACDSHLVGRDSPRNLQERFEWANLLLAYCQAVGALDVKRDVYNAPLIRFIPFAAVQVRNFQARLCGVNLAF